VGFESHVIAHTDARDAITHRHHGARALMAHRHREAQVECLRRGRVTRDADVGSQTEAAATFTVIWPGPGEPRSGASVTYAVPGACWFFLIARVAARSS
jgi:hypothetical protein